MACYTSQPTIHFGGLFWLINDILQPECSNISKTKRRTLKCGFKIVKVFLIYVCIIRKQWDYLAKKSKSFQFNNLDKIS